MTKQAKVQAAAQAAAQAPPVAVGQAVAPGTPSPVGKLIMCENFVANLEDRQTGGELILVGLVTMVKDGDKEKAVQKVHLAMPGISRPVMDAIIQNSDGVALGRTTYSHDVTVAKIRYDAANAHNSLAAAAILSDRGITGTAAREISLPQPDQFKRLTR